MSDFYIGICDFCRIAEPMNAVEQPAWDLKHLHTDTEEVDE
jgi:hypothetical protein